MCPSLGAPGRIPAFSCEEKASTLSEIRTKTVWQPLTESQGFLGLFLLLSNHLQDEGERRSRTKWVSHH